MPVDLYFTVTAKNYFYFIAIEIYATIYFSTVALSYIMFFDGMIIRMEVQFDRLANRVKEFLEMAESSRKGSTANRELIEARDNIVKHHQTIY